VFDYCGVEVDRDTARVRIDKYVTMHDSGKLLNPLLANGQVYGAFAWGVACALYEEFVYGEDGSFLTGTFADYLCPTACEIPEPTILHMQTPSMFTPLGAKGIGEGNCMSTPVCIANAVCDALGVDDVTLPLTPSKLSALIHSEQAPPATAPAAGAMPPGAGRTLSGGGEALVPAAPATVWDTLLEPQNLAAVIPGCRSLERVAENRYRARLTLGVGPVRGVFHAQVQLSELDPPSALTLSGDLNGPLGCSRGSGRMRLTPEAQGTRVRYDYAFEITGKVAAVGGRMLDGAARVVIGQFFERLIAQVGGQSAPASLSWWKRLLKALGMAP
jgi:2-furoyl-CoA dehydrogenase large subunit